MKKTFEEKIRSKQLHIAKSNPKMSRAAKIWYQMILFFYHLGISIGHNSKRLIMVAVSVLFFCVSSSFASPALVDYSKTEEALIQSDMEELSSIDFATEETQADTTEVIDDTDVIDGYEEEQLKNVDASDQYSVDDILSSNNFSTDSYTKTDITAIDSYEFDKEDWRLVLINKQHPIPDDYEVTLGYINTMKGVMQCDERIIEDLLAMLQAAKDDGVNLLICSPYRDYAYQEILFNRKITKYMNSGMSYMDAYKLSSQAVTVPGASEHQLGLALDIVCDTYTTLDEGFGETKAGLWLNEHSCEYGFILRYPLGKEYITSIEYEPWHFRYVGVEAATVITEKEITLEEFIESME